VDCAVSTLATDREALEFGQRRSLSRYAELGQSHAKPMPMYLDDRSNLVGTRLLTKCRLGYVMLMDNVGRMLNWPATRCVCVMCDDGAVEDMRHFLIECSALEPCRAHFRAEAKAALLLAGNGAQLATDALSGSPVEQLMLVLGGLTVFRATGDPEDVAKAAWALDKATKNFLVACWRYRAHLIGHLSVHHGSLVVEPATDARELRTTAPLAHTAQQMERCRPFWSSWIPREHTVGRSKRGKGRSPFFVVWVGRCIGIYTTWRECSALVSGYPGARFRGFDRMEEAQRAWREGPD